MHVMEYMDGKFNVKFMSTHSGHDLGVTELPHLPLLKGIKQK